jgi:hypothetical protein
MNMSNTEVSLFGEGYKGGLPAHLQNLELDDTTKALMGNSGTGKRISIRGGVFRMMVDGKEMAVNEDRNMNLVIVAANQYVSRTFYEGPYVEGEVKAPDCSSNDGITPDVGVPNKQANKCATCPQNIAGSGQGESRACRFSQRIAVVLENDLDGEVYQVQLPAQSIFGKAENGKHPLQSYAKLLGSHSLPVTAVVTEARFDTNSATPKLTFKAVRPLSAAEIKVVQKQGASDEAKAAIANTPANLDGAAQKAKGPLFEGEEETPEVAKPKTSKSETKRVNVMQGKPIEEGLEETQPVKTSKKKATPAVVEEAEDEGEEEPSAKVKSILDDISSWDDDA